jgi:polar amino acid transport system substrate-binding protein
VKRIALAAAALAIAAATAVAASAQTSAPPTKESGKLIVGFDVPAPGFWNGRVSGTTIKNGSGFEYSLAKEIAKAMGVPKVQYLRAPFATILVGGRKKYDFALEETTITVARARVIGFSTPYFNANQGVLIAKGVTKPRSIADLKRIQLCGVKDTTGLSYIQHKIRPTKRPLVYSASTTAVFDAIEAGRCQALIYDVPIIVSQANKKKGAYGGVVGQIDTNESYGAVMEKGSKLKPFVDRAIKRVIASGALGKLQTRWFGYKDSDFRVLK